MRDRGSVHGQTGHEEVGMLDRVSSGVVLRCAALCCAATAAAFLCSTRRARLRPRSSSPSG